RIFTDATDFYGLSVLIRRIRENPRFLLVAETMINGGKSLEGVFMLGQKIIYSLVLLIAVGVTICRPGMREHALNTSVQAVQTDWDSMAGSIGVVVYGKEGPRGNEDRKIIRLFNGDGSLWYEFSYYEDHALHYLKRPNADFAPYGFDPDYFGLTLKCVRSDADRYEVIVNEESSLRKFVKKDDPILKFQRWEEYVTNWSWVEFDASTNPPRIKPDISADVIRIPSLSKDYVIGFHPDKIEGDWLRISWNLSESSKKFQNKDEFGWVRWRDKENNLIVRPLKG
ncbi:MAG: hypothetical protein MOB07_00440, partial [Acidobacteria bacterium]|nr:hypothetical protein [Acidobacteriota bacterium]